MTNVSDLNRGSRRERVSTALLVKAYKRLGKVLLIRHLERRKIRTITCRDVPDLAESGNSACDNTASLRITNSVLNLDETRKQLGNKGSDGDCRNELGHVVDDTSIHNNQPCGQQSTTSRHLHCDFTLGSGELLAQTTGHERKSRGVNFRNERGSREEVNGVRNPFDRIDQGLDSGGNKAFYILVRNQSSGLLKRIMRSLLYISLGIPNRLREDRDDIGSETSSLDRGTDDKLVENGERTRLDVPFISRLNLVEKGRKYKRSRPRVHRCDERPHCLDGGCPHSGHLVGKTFQKSSIET